ncbi:MAG: aryl-sulfate sulfotransferase [Bacteroidia bacterium]|nr:aryl-sulfate sulfotransferase [Bacteroidia bacterium]
MSQNTVGLISYDPMKTFDGYNLMFPHNQSSVFLLNNCGEIVQEWTDDANWRPGNIAYITEDGLLYKGKRDASVVNDPIWAGGGGAILEIRDWDNNLIWDFEMNDSIYRLHHDFSVMPNGNIIALAWELKTTEECIAAGRDTSTLAQGILWPDWIFEIDPFNDSIVWEWHAWDHLVQDFDSTKANFGVISEHPELIDVNYGRPDGHPDWHHGNSLDYNAELRQIMVSIPYFDEIWIIDHTTTTEQAAGHTGGWSNRGGDLMFRWGNPRSYQQGDSLDQRFFFEHDAHWIDDFLDFGHPYYGKVAVFNNRFAPDYSVAHILSPEFLDYGWMYNMQDGVFTPKEVDMTFQHPDTFALFSTGLSSIQILPNNNTLITDGRHGYTFEMTPDNEIVWEYITPLKGGVAVSQGDTTLAINNNLTFRMKRYPADFPGFDNKNLDPKGFIELDPDTTFCDNLVAVEDLMIDHAFKVYPNPVDQAITIEWDGMKYAQIEIYNLQGIKLSGQKCSGGRKFLDVSTLPNGIYFISIRTEDSFYSRKFVIQH